MRTVLQTDADLYNAVLFQTPVTVYFRGVCYEPSAGGFIESFTDEHVVINGEYFSRKVCEFRMEQNRKDML